MKQAIKLRETFEADAIATVIGSTMGITTVSTYIESTAMAVEGGRTGFSGVVTSVLFILAIFIAPFASVIPSAATATTLIITGVFMMAVIRRLTSRMLRRHFRHSSPWRLFRLHTVL